eukprot:UN25182
MGLKIKRRGSTERVDNARLYRLWRLLYVIFFIPHAWIPRYFNAWKWKIERECSSASLQGLGFPLPKLQEFFVYLETWYFAIDARFQVTLWSQYGRGHVRHCQNMGE